MMDARARVLQMQGARSDDVVILMMSRGKEAVIDMLALWALGARIVPVRPDRTLPELQELQSLTNAKTYLRAGKTIECLERHRGGAATVPTLTFHSETPGFLPLHPFQMHSLQVSGEGTRQDLFNHTALGFTPVHEPASVPELWAVLSHGGTVELVTDDDAKTGSGLVHSLCYSPVDLVHATVSLLCSLRTIAPSQLILSRVRKVLVATSARNQKQRLHELFPLARLHDL